MTVGGGEKARWIGKTQRPSLARGGEILRGIQRGQIFWAMVPPKHIEGSEQTHDVPSPWLIVSSNDVHGRLAVAQGVPLSSRLDKEAKFRVARVRIALSEILDYDFPQTGTAPDRHLDGHDQLALTEQTRVLSHRRLLGDPIAILTPRALYSVEAGLRYVLGIAPST